MAEIINLRLVRKARTRLDRDAAAEANRLAFGRGKAEKQRTSRLKANAERSLDGHKREDAGGDA